MESDTITTDNHQWQQSTTYEPWTTNIQNKLVSQPNPSVPYKSNELNFFQFIKFVFKILLKG